jgi:hypothetical protein
MIHYWVGKRRMMPFLDRCPGLLEKAVLATFGKRCPTNRDRLPRTPFELNRGNSAH